MLKTPGQAIARVRRRVRESGHDIPVEDIKRRFMRSREHLVTDYLSLATRWVIWDNASIPAKSLALSELSDINAVIELLK